MSVHPAPGLHAPSRSRPGSDNTQTLKGQAQSLLSDAALKQKLPEKQNVTKGAQ